MFSVYLHNKLSYIIFFPYKKKTNKVKNYHLPYTQKNNCHRNQVNSVKRQTIKKARCSLDIKQGWMRTQKSFKKTVYWGITKSWEFFNKKTIFFKNLKKKGDFQTPYLLSHVFLPNPLLYNTKMGKFLIRGFLKKTRVTAVMRKLSIFCFNCIGLITNNEKRHLPRKIVLAIGITFLGKIIPLFADPHPLSIFAILILIHPSKQKFVRFFFSIREPVERVVKNRLGGLRDRLCNFRGRGLQGRLLAIRQFLHVLPTCKMPFCNIRDNVLHHPTRYYLNCFIIDNRFLFFFSKVSSLFDQLCIIYHCILFRLDKKVVLHAGVFTPSHSYFRFGPGRGLLIASLLLPRNFQKSVFKSRKNVN